MDTVLSATGQGDLVLALGVRSNDARSATLLLDRHRDAVAELGPSPAFDSVEASGRMAVALLRSGTDQDLPFRALWLALHARGSLPEARPHDAVVWGAFRSLPPAWRLAVWHREVEGQRPRQIARHLDMAEEQATRALGSAYASLKRRVALAHTDVGPSAYCQDLVSRYRFSPPASLTAAEARSLREHGRHCDHCLALIRHLFLVEHTLRDTLAAVVLGEVAEAYLGRHPRPARLRVAAADQPLRPERRVHPVFATLTAAGIGAAAMALVVSTPVVSPVGDGAPRALAGDAPVPGATLWPRVPAAVPGVSVTPAGTISPLAVEAATGTPVSSGAAGQGPDSGQTGDGPGEQSHPAPTPPATPPPPPPTPAPTPPVDGPDEPTDESLSVAVAIGDDAAVVEVDSGPEAPPVVVEVPVPDPLPDLPEVPEVPLGLPVSSTTGAWRSVL